MSGPRAVIAGGGVYGWGIALRLAELGAHVTVVDPRGLGDEQRASGALTRVLRLEYGNAAHYSDFALRARARWREIEQATGTDLYREVGVLFLVPEGDRGDWERASLDQTRALGHPATELEPDEIARRWPAIRPAGVSWGMFNPTGGFLWAHRATATLARLARAGGVELVADEVVRSDARGVTLRSGERVGADVVVLATGAWSRRLASGLPIRSTRQVTAYLSGGPGDVPVFADGAPFAMYGIPAHDGLGMKIGSHVPGPEGDPDEPSGRVVTGEDVGAIGDYAMRRFRVAPPEVAIARADVCFYALTPTEDPVVDRLPDGRVACAGFSGHGFKFAPVLAAAAAELALEREPSIDLAPFRLDP